MSTCTTVINYWSTRAPECSSRRCSCSSFEVAAAKLHTVHQCAFRSAETNKKCRHGDTLHFHKYLSSHFSGICQVQNLHARVVWPTLEKIHQQRPFAILTFCQYQMTSLKSLKSRGHTNCVLPPRSYEPSCCFRMCSFM